MNMEIMQTHSFFHMHTLDSRTSWKIMGNVYVIQAIFFHSQVTLYVPQTNLKCKNNAT